MKIGINRWTMPGDWPLVECFRAAKQAGFDSIEINVAEEGELTPLSTEADVHRIAASAKAAGVELSSLSTGLGWQYPLTSGDLKVREQGMATIRASLHIARWMGVDTILCVPGVVTAEIAYDEAYDRAQGVLKELASEAARLRVCIGVENVWNKFLLSPLEMARFVDEIGSDWVGVYFDAGNVVVYGYPHHWIRILGARIKKIHVKDFKANIGNISAFCNPLQGDVPWASVREALESVGYDGYITAEVDGYRIHPEIGLRHIAESLRRVFN